jgi:methylmalonyl-CoA mutase N-terminal domain/subunit
VADSIDPLAGSYLIEHLTDEIERLASDYIQKIDDMGGAMKSIERGYMQNEIQDAAYAAQKAIESGEQVVVGVNQFQTKEEITLERQSIDPAIEAEARQRLATLRANRDNARIAELRGQLEAAAKGSENVMPLFVECVENKMTLGEVCNTLRGVWGEYVAAGF